MAKPSAMDGDLRYAFAPASGRGHTVTGFTSSSTRALFRPLDCHQCPRLTIGRRGTVLESQTNEATLAPDRREGRRHASSSLVFA